MHMAAGMLGVAVCTVCITMCYIQVPRQLGHEVASKLAGTTWTAVEWSGSPAEPIDSDTSCIWLEAVFLGTIPDQFLACLLAQQCTHATLFATLSWMNQLAFQQSVSFGNVNTITTGSFAVVHHGLQSL